MLLPNVMCAEPQTVAEIPTEQSNGLDEIINNRIPEFFFYLKVQEPRNTLTKSDLPSCGEVLKPGYILFKQLSIDVKKSTYHKIELKPGKDTPGMDSILNCNPFTNTDCKGCAVGQAGVEAQLTVTRGESEAMGLGVSVLTKRLMLSKCVFFRQADCGPKFCSNGEYASEFLVTDINGYSVSKNTCVPCSPGTWLTCIDDAACTYNIQKTPGSLETNGKIYKPDGLDLVGKCFDCKSAGNNKVHYGKTSKKTIIQEGAGDPLRWYCPGGSDPPVLCPLPFAGANANFTACVCQPGQYLSLGYGCQICPSGSMCPNGERIECPDGTYQNNTGATMCNSCLFADGMSNECESRFPPKKMRKCKFPYKSEIPLCVGCNACIRPYGGVSAGTVECY